MAASVAIIMPLTIRSRWIVLMGNCGHTQAGASKETRPINSIELQRPDTFSITVLEL